MLTSKLCIGGSVYQEPSAPVPECVPPPESTGKQLYLEQLTQMPLTYFT
jgi:hypothetical protein